MRIAAKMRGCFASVRRCQQWLPVEPYFHDTVTVGVTTFKTGVLL